MVPLLSVALAAALAWLAPSSVQPGQRGVCVTEWSGGERLEIPIEVVGVLDAPAPERSRVLIRLDDERFAESGVVQGMSGSPVYVGGRLLGAVASGWAFARTPLAGVTPFETMHGISSGSPSPAAGAPRLAEVAAVAGRTAAPLAALPTLPDRSDAGALPLAVAGLPAPSGEILAALGGQVVAPAGRTDLGGVPAPGEMLAALLVWGDAVVGAAGTVTALEGDTMWAFGHPYLNLGGVSLPAARARVLAVQESFQVPFKFFVVGEPFGTVVADRLPGVLVRLGEVPAGLPVHISVGDEGGSTTWSFRVAELPLVEPLLVTYLTNACLTARGAAAGFATVAVRLDVRLADGRSVVVSQATRGTDALARVAGFTGGVIGLLANSPFPHPELTSVDVELVRKERAAGATISEVIPARATVHAGERLDVVARLQPIAGAPQEVALALDVPRSTPAGPIDLVVADGAAWSEYRLKAAAIEPASFADQLDELRRLESSTTLVAVLEDRAGGVALPGVSQAALPPSWAATLATGLGREGGLKRLNTAVVASARRQLADPLIGAFRVKLRVLPPRPEMP